MASKISTSCCNVGYDILTIIISIADVTTDIIVLIDFYYKDRMVFFAISLSILILAQCSYAMACAVRYDTIDNWKPWKSCLTFCCLIPFGTFVAFCIYFGSEETGLDCFSSFLSNDMHLNTGTGSWLSPQSRDSEMVKWIKRKLDRHLGFILEAAIEAFPQSLLQIIAIVYYEEANYISIISILLSMFSVMSKSLILSQGIEKYTFIWTWLCVVTDFYGIFFTLTWVFYSHEAIHGNFLGYFNIFGEIWIWKFAISTLLPVTFALIVFFGFGYWFVYCLMLWDDVDCSNIAARCGWSCLWIILSPIVALICAFGACLGCEVFCFSLFALAVYTFSTDRISDNRSDHTSDLVAMMLHFISKGRDKRLRVLSINKGLSAIVSKKSKKVCIFIDKTLEAEGYEGLKQITYADIRNNCADSRAAALFPDFFHEMMDEYKSMKDRSTGDIVDRFFNFIQFLTFSSLFFWAIPVLLISKILQILYPWIILFYVLWNDLLFTNQIDLFQKMMLLVSIGLQLVLLCLSIHVIKINWYLWHIQPGVWSVYWVNVDVCLLERETHKFYDNICWYPQVTMIVLNSFLGSDIGKIVMDYCRSFQLDENAYIDNWP